MRFRPSEVAVLIGRGRGTTSGLTKAAEKYIRTKWVEVEKGFKPEVSSKYLTKGIEQGSRCHGVLWQVYRVLNYLRL